VFAVILEVMQGEELPSAGGPDLALNSQSNASVA
jgi:hypothetical protein